jgi:hypothetical protein
MAESSPDSNQPESCQLQHLAAIIMQDRTCGGISTTTSSSSSSSTGRAQHLWQRQLWLWCCEFTVQVWVEVLTTLPFSD